MTADQFADEAIPPGKMPPVIALSACYTDVAEADGAASFAQRLCERGASAVIATETSITDSYAIRVFARLYERLTDTSAPDIVTAVADARRAVHQELAALPGPPAAAEEWAVLSVLARTGSMPLVDPHAPPRDAPWRTRPRIPGLIDREAGEFVGRRRELRSWPAQLADTSTAGIVIHGIGGIGKTTLASELAHRYAETRGQAVIACHRGPAGVDTLLATITSALRRHLIDTGTTASPLYGALAACAAPDIPWHERMAYLTGQILPGLPALLLILDNFEDNLSGGQARVVADPDLAGLLADLAAAPATTRLLVTSRYPFTLPGHAEQALTFHQAAPLSLAETLKLIWALPALDRLDTSQAEQVWRLLGGHPRALEYLDALLAHGHGRFPDITQRLATAVQHHLSDTGDADAFFAATSQLNAALAETVTLAADDILLGELLIELRATAGAVELLQGAAVYREPVDDNALLFQVGIPDPSPAPPPDRQAAEEAIRDILASAGIGTDEPVDIQALPEPVRRAIMPHWEAYT
ncbi:MAG TPA: AAA family ATPase, partial [Streptosporangiaceae bacterium]|nr:AAA family ATPase [Streptosporangiaceae bacterium]